MFFFYDFLIIFILILILFGLSILLFNQYNIIISIIAIEVLLYCVNLLLVVLSLILDDVSGQIASFLVVTLAASESALALALMVIFFRSFKEILLERFQ